MLAIKFTSALVLGVSVAACSAHLPPRDCHSAKIDPAPYTASVAPAKTETMPKGARIAVRAYKVSSDSTRVAPCSQIELRKEVTLQRDSEARLTIKEAREFYAEDGTLIVRAVDDVSHQLARSGTYAARLALPIPLQAPPGQYRIVNKLLLETDTQKSTLLASAGVTFSVVAAAPVQTPRPAASAPVRRPVNLKNPLP